MSGFKDHFSTTAADYRRYRPGYPAALFDFLAAQAPENALAWDCATGTGQGAVALSRHFRRVIASDASDQQIARAEPATGVEYRVAPAEAIDLPDATVDLVCVAQALHWFDIPAFFAEAGRVLVPGGLLAIWSYNLLRIEPTVDALIDRLYHETLAGHWPPERALIESGYAEIALPFVELSPPTLAMRADWTPEQLCGYLGTWSAVGRYRAASGDDPVAALATALGATGWSRGEVRPVHWPLTLRLARKPR